MYSDRIMELTLTIKCMKQNVSITYSIERVAHLGRLALFLNRADFCSFLSQQLRSDYQKLKRFIHPQ